MPNYESLWEVATAINKGYFEEQGLDIKLSSFQVDEAGIGLMASGSVDVAYIGADVHKRCIEGAAQIFCSSLKVSGETADCQLGMPAGLCGGQQGYPCEIYKGTL